MSRIIIENCANSAASCLEAQKGGAHRVELCAGMPEGGTTPSYGEILAARKNINIALNVIIRPRGGDFLYSDQEIEIMKSDIKMAKELGADGVVFGCLTPEGKVDKTKCEYLLKQCQGLNTTFHRAFDATCDPSQALEDIIELGFDRILSSGCKATAYEGRFLLKELIIQANSRIIIMPGCGINENNIKEIRDTTGAHEFHSSAKEQIESNMLYRNPQISMGTTNDPKELTKEFTKDQTSPRKIQGLIEAVGEE